MTSAVVHKIINSIAYFVVTAIFRPKMREPVGHPTTGALCTGIIE